MKIIAALILLTASGALGCAQTHLGKHTHEIADPTVPTTDPNYRAWVYEDGVPCGFAYPKVSGSEFVAYYHYITGEDIPDTTGHHFATEREAREYIERRCK